VKEIKLKRLFAIGDIHGCARELGTLLTAIAPRHGDEIVFLGDYIDRGRNSRGVIDRLLELEATPGVSCVFLKGNHEDMFSHFLGERGKYGDAFIGNGGDRTLASYGIDGWLRGPAVRDALPPAHLSFFRRLHQWHFSGPFLFVHGGVNPTRPLVAQRAENLFWIREEFIFAAHPFPHVVVFGHTPVFRYGDVPRGSLVADVYWDLPHKIGIDTACAYGGKLTAIELTGGKLYQVRSGASRAIVTAELPELGRVVDIASDHCKAAS
jgi:serine/threonine protein phosphatase 1